MVAIPRFIPGDRVGNYEIVREVGAHGGGVVYEAAHRVLPRRATLKVMHGIVPALAVQIMREACILEALQHPGIVKVFESGVLPDRRPWFALELVPGEALSTVLARGSLRAVETVTLVKELAEILEHAHRRGVIHHGLRPDRVMLDERSASGARSTPEWECGLIDRRLCIVDWSEARAHDASNQIPHIPSPAARAYVAPEVARGDVTDDRADVYALGVIAYQALTGALPTPAAHIPAAQRCRNAPPELTLLIEQMLAPDRFDRPTAAEVRSELAWLASILEAAPPEHVELVDTDGVAEAPLPRLRKPRWTPPISYVASDLAVLVSGEIELD